MATAVAAARSPFAVVHLPGPRTEPRTLSFWTRRVIVELHTLRSAPEPDTVHDLRVAVRRCRALAAVMQEVDPDPCWPQLRKVARKLFRGLGAVRDAQVMEEWIKKLAPENDSLGPRLLAALQSGEQERTEAALRVASKFDERKWLSLDRALRRRIRLIPIGGLGAECLALERFDEAKNLHHRALRSEKPKTWHGLRIGLKKFRYTVEGFLPEHAAAWIKNLKRLQDLLGDIHDLDVLAQKIRELEAPEDSVEYWLHKIGRERHDRVETYRQLTLGRTSIWNEWRHNLPHGQRLELAATARLRSTARAADAHSSRTSQESRLALRIFDILRRLSATPAFADATARRIFESAALLHGVGTWNGHRLSPKSVRKFLSALPLPPNWSSDKWDVLSWAVRFQRGAEPKLKNGFAKLSEDQQLLVRTLAGVLRLARALRKSGIESPVGLRSEKSADAFLLRIPGLADTAETAGRLANAKHLLESVLSKPLILKPVTRLEPSAPPSETLLAPRSDTVPLASD